jgi:hypothetical protein
MTKLKLKNLLLKIDVEKDLDQTNPLYASATDELPRASITPKTLHSKTFWTRDDQDTTPLRSLEEYVYGQSKVVKFCINAGHINVDQSTQTIILGESREAVGKPIGSMNTQQYPRATSDKALLSELEKDMLIDAIKHPDPIVLVDIFERSNGATINLDATTENKHPAIHTVLLYKIPGNAASSNNALAAAAAAEATSTFVAVIDPSNFLYSSHLCNSNFSAELSAEGLPQISTIHTQKIQIYKAQDSKVGTGNAPHQYRDCSDIAVKLAFGFQMNPLGIFKDANSFKDEKNIDCLTQHPVVVQISNATAIDKSIIEPKIPARVKQASDELHRQHFMQKQFEINQKQMATKAKAPLVSQKIKEGYGKIITKGSSHDGVIAALSDLVKIADQMITSYEQLEQHFDSIIGQCVSQMPAP